MTKNFMDSVPVSLEEAAWVDGAGSMTALRRIVVPLMRQGIAVVFIFVFTQAWGNFFVPFVLLFSPDNQPAAVAIYSFFGTYGTVAYGRLAAFSILYSVPVLVLYLLVQRFSGGSFAMSGAVKADARPRPTRRSRLSTRSPARQEGPPCPSSTPPPSSSASSGSCTSDRHSN